MATTWTIIQRQVAARLNAIEGAQSSTAESNYATNPITSTQIDSARFPFTMISDACLQAEAMIAQAIANTANHPWRRLIAGTTSNIAHEGALPSTSSGGLPILGALGNVRDATDGTPCTEKPLEIITMRVENPGSFWTLPVYFYKIDDGRVFHTRTNVVIDCCIYDGAAARSDLEANGNIKFPDTAVPAYVAGALASALKDEEFVTQAQYYQQVFDTMLQVYAGGLTSLTNKFQPSPQTGSQTV